MICERLSILAACALFVTGSGAAWAGEEEKGKKGGGQTKDEPAGKKEEAAAADFSAWGTIKEVKDAERFFTLDYTKVDGQKAKKLSAFVKIPEDVELYRDRLLRINDIKEGDTVWLLGRPVEAETQTPQGVAGVDRQMQNVQVIALGEGLRASRTYRDPKDKKVLWCEAKVKKAGAAISVEYEGNTYSRVTLAKNVQIFTREKAPDAKGLKNGALVEVAGEKSEERPATKNAADARKEVFLAKKAVLLDRRLQAAVYPALSP